MKNKYLWGILPLIPILIFSSQGHILRERFGAIGCSVVSPKLTSAQVCQSGICEQTYSIEIKKSYLALGNIIETHRVFDSVTGVEVSPAAATNTLPEIRWPELFVYKFDKPSKIFVKTKVQEFSSMKGFSGVDPRECPDDRVLSVVNIPKILTGVSKSFLAIFVAIAFLASVFGASSNQNVPFYSSPRYLSIAVGSFMLSFLLGDHFFDVLKPSIRVSEDSLRSLALFGLVLPAFSFTRNKWSWIAGVASGILALCLYVVDHSYVQIFDGLSVYRVAFMTAVIIGMLGLLKRRDWFGVLIFIPACIDSIHVFGVRIPDFPPIYWNLFVTGTFCMKIAWKQGVEDILPLAWRALELARANFNFHTLSKLLDSEIEKNMTFQPEGHFENAFRLIPRATSCGRVGLLFLARNGTPVTVTYDVSSNIYRSFDDGKVEGHIFSRVLIYKEQFWFESIERLKEVGYNRLEETKELEDARYFCAIPLFDRGNLIGILSFTRFNDRIIGAKNQVELREQIKMQIELVAKRLEGFFQTKALSEFEKSKENVELLRASIDDFYTTAKDDASFFDLVLSEFEKFTASTILVFRRSSREKAELWLQKGLSPDEERAWKEVPLNVSPNVGNKIGPYIVAFNEGKGSYIKRIEEIFEQLHPHSRSLFARMSAQTVITVPLKMVDDDYVISIISRKNTETLSHTWADIFDEIKPTIIANIQALRKSSSLEAYGRLATRFIDNPETRNSLLSLAKEGDLPTTVGHTVGSLIFVVDLIGSSNLNLDPQTKANLYGEFYDRLAYTSKTLLQVSILKKSGDGAILGGVTPLSGDTLQKNIAEFVSDSDATAIRLGCTGARVSVHFGEYFVGLIGTKSSGAIDAIGSGIDHACKLEDQMKAWKQHGLHPRLGFTKAAFNYLIAVGALPRNDLAPSGTSFHFESFYLFDRPQDILFFPVKLLVLQVDSKVA